MITEKVKMLHLSVKKDFTYLNYLSVMSAVRYNEVTIWIIEEPSNEYWSIIKKLPFIKFEYTTAEKGITLKVEDKTGRLNIIYIGELTDRYVDDDKIDHTGLYEVDGEFETKDMCLVRISKPEVVTPDYIRNSGTLLAELVKRVLLERVWNVKI